MEKKTIYAISALILAVLIIFSVLFYSPKDNNNSILNKSCVLDSDCAKVQESCCPCNMSGEEKCILLSEKADYEEKLKLCSERMICAAVFNCNSKSCRCVNGICSF